MFRESLLESAPSNTNRKRWPMALAFTAEIVVAALLVAVPLLSTGVISVSAHVPPVPPLLHVVRVVDRTPPGVDRMGGSSAAHTSVVALNNNPNTLFVGQPQLNPDDDASNSHPDFNIGGKGLPTLPAGCIGCQPPVRERDKPVRISAIAEGQLLNRVEPVYPRTAAITGIQGAVRLHAIISKNGVIESLSVISGHPLLTGAALDAVRQWRYRPYLLNGEAVEVETFITVNFKKTNE
jgi:protein TonB